MGVAGLSAKLANIVQTKIAPIVREVGRDITYTRTAYTIDPTKPWQPTDTTGSSYSIKGVFSGAKLSQSLEGPVKRIDDVVTVNFEDLGFLPLKGDVVSYTFLETVYTYKVTNVTQCQPGNNAFVYDLEIKK